MFDRQFLEKGVINLVLSLYNETSISRSCVQMIVSETEKFISEFYVSFLLEKLSQEFNYDKTICNKIDIVLNDNKQPFENFATEQLRFKMLKKHCNLQLPKKYNIGHEMVNDVRTPIQIAHVPIEYSLKSTLEIPGLFQDLKKYMQQLCEEKTLISNIIQARFWRNRYSTLVNETKKTVLPLIIYYDDFETGNALGSHTGEQALGGVYVSLPCLPPHLVAKLRNIFIALVFYTKHRKLLGNNAIFHEVISNINKLIEQGLELSINGIKELVHFECILFVGDNLGLNSACGFVESFGKCLRYCRICTATSDQCQLMCEEDSALLRNRENYEKNVNEISFNATSYDSGIKENCIFNRITNYHIVENKSVDLMHDIFEGVAGYTISKILTVLIFEQKYFTLKTLNDLINNFNYGDVEKSNKPRMITKENSKKAVNDVIKNKIKLKQSSSEMLCLTRYLGAIIGYLIPENNEYWKLYLTLRRLIGMLLSPRFVESNLIHIKHLITKFNKGYIKLFGRLKPKMHFLIHIPEIMREFGPLVNIWCMPFERKNKQLKDTLSSSTSNINVPWTVCLKSQLQQCYLNHHYEHVKTDVSLGSVESDNSTEIHNFCSSIICATTFKFINICGKQYSIGSIIVIKVTDEGPVFGQIKRIFNDGNDTLIVVTDIVINYFKRHYYAYRVEIQLSSHTLINVCDLPRIDPCLLINIKNNMYVITRYDI